MTVSVKSWPPARYSAPLSEDFPSDGVWLLKIVDLCWRNDDGSKMVLDQWQRSLILHILELYPEGHPKAGQLRYRECFVSVARQNGKSVIGAILAMYGLLREKGALVIGLASNADQANIIYRRVLEIIRADPRLAKRFMKASETRGIVSKDNSLYQVKASKSGAVQGLATSLGIIDELHITSPALWSDLVNGTAAKPRGLVFGITTAGDEESELLIRLYKVAEDAPERFGYFIWESLEASVPDEDELLGQYIMQANPSVAEGRRPLSDEIAAVRTQPKSDVIHYRLNRFVASLNPYMPSDKWVAAEAGGEYIFPTSGQMIFIIDQTPDDGFASIVQQRRAANGVTHSRLVASVPNPTFEQLLRLVERLWQFAPDLFVADGYKLRPLMQELRKRGYPVHIGTAADAVNSASLLYAKVLQRTFIHAGDELVNMQMTRSVRKNKGDVYRIDRANSSTEIDAVLATALGALVIETVQELGPQIF